MSELRWLVALEAWLFFSVACWETTATYAAPTYEPVEFGLALVGAATVGMLACHVGPALYSSRFPVPGWALAWLVFGYLEWLWSFADPVQQLVPFGGRFSFEITVAITALLVFYRSLWRFVFIPLSILGVAMLAWALTTQWQGIWAVNPYFGTDQATIMSPFINGVVLKGVPGIALALRIGQLATLPKTIWWSGFLGIWLPAVSAIAVASVAADAGATLHWRPTLFRGFYWAAQGAERLNETALVAMAITLFTSMLIAAYALRQLAASWQGRKAAYAIPLGLWIGASFASPWLVRPYGLPYAFFTETHRLWAWSVIALGLAAFLPVSGRLKYHRHYKQ